MNVLDPKDSVLLIIDVQERLVNTLNEAKSAYVNKVATLVKAARILEIPTVVTEQYPKGLGVTVSEVSDELAEDTQVFEKTAFNALSEEGVMDKLKSYERRQVVVCGMETAICVHQTVAALIRAGYEVFVVEDASAGRSKYESDCGINLMKSNGTKITCVVTTIFEWLQSAKHPYFKEIQALIK